MEHRGVGDDPGLAGGDLGAVGGRGELEGVGPGVEDSSIGGPFAEGTRFELKPKGGPKMTSVLTDVRLAE